MRQNRERETSDDDTEAPTRSRSERSTLLEDVDYAIALGLDRPSDPARDGFGWRVPDQAFWEQWRSNKVAMRAAGYRVTRGDDGHWLSFSPKQERRLPEPRRVSLPVQEARSRVWRSIPTHCKPRSAACKRRSCAGQRFRIARRLGMAASLPDREIRSATRRHGRRQRCSQYRYIAGCRRIRS